MRRYSTSVLRIVLLGALLAASLVVVSDGLAQDASTTPPPQAPAARTAPAAAPAAEQKQDIRLVVRLILSHMDPVFFVIAALSIAGLTLIIQGFITNRAAVLLPEEAINRMRDMIANRQFQELMDYTEQDRSFISRALNPALKRAPSFSAMKDAMETAIGEQTAEQFRKIEYLNIIGNLGPLLGLLGTVLGMIYAFDTVSSSGGQADVGRLSNGIAIALVHTFLGLFLAVPCLAAFGVLRTLVDRLTVRGALIAEELLMMIKPPDGKPVVGPIATPARPPVSAVPPGKRPAVTPSTDLA